MISTPPPLPASANATRTGPRVLISILNWNGLADTLQCLSRIAPVPGGLCQVVVIDNGSATDPQAELLALYPSVEYIRLPSNRGFAGGQNHGMQLAIDRGLDAVLLLNNDCEIDADAVAALYACLQSNTALAAVSPLIYCLEQRDKPQMVASWFDWAHHRSIRPSRPEATPPPAMPIVLPGTALMLRCSALKTIGLLDERYFAYYEDNDISARIAQHGLLASYCPDALAWHSSRPTHAYSPMALYLSARNAWLFWKTHTPQEFRSGLFRHLLAQSLYEIAILKKAGAHAKCAAVVAGFWAGQRQRFGPPPAQLHAPKALVSLMCVAPYLLYDLLSDPVKAIRTRWPLAR